MSVPTPKSPGSREALQPHAGCVAFAEMGDSSEPMHDPVLATDQPPTPTPEDQQTMHVHKIKPVHGWREFASEIMIIVIGIVIALAGEQMVEWNHIRTTVAEVREAMRTELGGNRARIEQDRSQTKCALSRLDMLDHWTATATTGSRIFEPTAPALWNLHSSAWEVAKTSAAVAHFELAERLQYANAYDSVTNEQKYLFDEQENWRQLRASLATANEPSNRAQISREVALARLNIQNRQDNSGALLKRLDAMHIAADRTRLPQQVDVTGLCKPLGA